MKKIMYYVLTFLSLFLCVMLWRKFSARWEMSQGTASLVQGGVALLSTIATGLFAFIAFKTKNK